MNTKRSKKYTIPKINPSNYSRINWYNTYKKIKYFKCKQLRCIICMYKKIYYRNITRFNVYYFLFLLCINVSNLVNI